MRKTISVILSVLMILSSFSVIASVSAKETNVSPTGESYSGTTGDCKWSFDEDTETLTISGNGDMENYEPWIEYLDEIKTIVIEDGVTSVGDYAFFDCSKLTSITIPDSVISIGNSAFYRCSSLASVLIPNGVTSIGEYAFRECPNLTNVIIPESVTSIGYRAFEDCSSLASVTIPSSITSIGWYAFDGCSGLKDVFYNGNRRQFYNIENIDDNESLSNATLHCKVKTDGGTTGDCTWSYDEDTETLTISGIGEMGDYFYLNDDVCAAPWYAYSALIKTIVIEDGVTSVGDYTFYDCSSLTSITIPNSVTSIGGYVFEDCSILKNVYYLGSEEQWKLIEIEDNNDELLNTNITYNYIPTEPTTPTEPTISTTEPTTVTTSTVTETEPTTVSTTEPSTSTVTETEPTTVPTTTQPTTTKPTVKKVTKVEVSKKSVALLKGRSTTVKVKVSPTNATNKKLKWTTSNAKVATVNQSGKITAKGKGTATIKVMTTDGSNKYATVKVTVKQPVTSVKLNKKSANLKVKGNAKQKTVTLKATVNPKNADNKSVKWTTSNSKIAAVNSKGQVTAKKIGTCFIYATAKDGSKKSAKCKITVK